MAAKRFFDDSEQDSDNKPSDKRIRPTTPSLASVIQEVVTMKNTQNQLLPFLEPLLKRVVGEEVEKVMKRCFPPPFIARSPSLRIQQAPSEQPSTLQLSFNKRLSLPIFTGSRILDIEGNPITIVLVDKTNINNNGQGVPTSLPYPIKLELVVLNGDFTPGDNEDWTSEQFRRHVVKERAGKRPLLAGEMNLIMRDGIAPTGDIEFTDNSSWIRSRKFRIAVRVSSNYQGVRIREGITEAFVVKDHRGELYKKHHPPMLHDDVWRLEKIGKDGAFHKKLTSEGIKTVQDFLKLAVTDSPRLRRILGLGMSEKMWEVTIKHALTCDMGSKIYIYRGPQFTIFLNPICKLIRADINGQIFSSRELNNMNKSYIDKLVREAYGRWHNLEEIDGVLNENIALLTQGDQTVEQFPSNDPASVLTYNQNYYYGDKSTEVASYVPNNNAQMGCSEWSLNPAYTNTTTLFANGFPYGFSASQSDGDITPSGSGSADVDGATRQH
ncbi:protein SAR DEFICIENT 1-like [Lotus japonicus]|uniref:protein SAR DEFICIENT 1-like n=1 Tax=Lotus japonicus TaxID=34305 RepID=UPI00258C3C74|nr:protein SAR DEFICIENT 1-like [Lotus japonicus]